MSTQVCKNLLKQKLLNKFVEHIDITRFGMRPIIDSMAAMSFTSRDLARATQIFNTMLQDEPCSIILSIAGSTSAGGCMKLYTDLIKYNMVDAIVAAGASIADMDFFEALGFRHYQGNSSCDDRKLRDLHIVGSMIPISMKNNFNAVIMSFQKLLIIGVTSV